MFSPWSITVQSIFRTWADVCEILFLIFHTSWQSVYTQTSGKTCHTVKKDKWNTASHTALSHTTQHQTWQSLTRRDSHVLHCGWTTSSHVLPWNCKSTIPLNVAFLYLILHYFLFPQPQDQGLKRRAIFIFIFEELIPIHWCRMYLPVGGLPNPNH